MPTATAKTKSKPTTPEESLARLQRQLADKAAADWRSWAVAFADGGNAFNRQDPFADKLEALRFAWGFGIRWFSPIGPLRFEWGFPFAPTEEEASSVFEFSIGNFF